MKQTRAAADTGHDEASVSRLPGRARGGGRPGGRTCSRGCAWAPRVPSAAPNRKTWQELSQEYVAPVSLDQAVQDTIDVIEGHSRGHLLSSVRVLCQVTPPPPPSWLGVFSASGREAPAVYPQAPVQAHRAFPGMGHSKVPATEPCWRCPASASCPPCARVLCPEGEGQSLLPAGWGEGPCPSSGPDLALLLRPALACHVLPRAPPWTGSGSTSVSICCLGPPDLLLLPSCQAS